MIPAAIRCNRRTPSAPDRSTRTHTRTGLGFAPARVAAALLVVAGCGSSMSTTGTPAPAPSPTAAPEGERVRLRAMEATRPTPDPRVGLKAGLTDAGEAIWNLRLVSATPPASDFVGVTNSDLAFRGDLVIQGNFNGYMVWNISNPAQPTLVKGFVCPASQSDVSIYRNLLFVSGEDFRARLDCGAQGVADAVSHDRLRGIRIFDITDIQNPRYIANVQTCRGSHTHSVVEDPNDPNHVYIYVSGSAPVRPAQELAGCSSAPLREDPNSALFRIEVIRVPLANPERAAIVSSPRIFNDLVAPATHGLASEDLAEVERARATGAFIVEVMGQTLVLPTRITQPMLDSIVKARGATGAPTSADSAALRESLPSIIGRMFGVDTDAPGPRPGPTQCHDITAFPEVGLAGGACEGYGFLLDISDPVNPRRIAAVADSNFSYWHSATFNNDGTRILFTDEWGGGGGPKCRATDPKEWGANAIFTIENRQLRFRSYYKLPAPQTPQENCVAHNGSMIPIPGRDVMVQGWYQGGISVFDWTDPANPVEIAFHDRGPIDADRMLMGGSWSVYWYNGLIVSSEIARGLDIFELVPGAFLTQNEIDAANTVKLEYLNAQGQPHYQWPPSFALARAFVDQLERSNGLPATRITALRQELTAAERATGNARRDALTRLASQVDADAAASGDAAKRLATALRDLAAAR
ncbi:MAG: hypothetical protein L0271_05745 [Gemmatimonadetes bacterium]|nr:hypothetical protein [Gemmatimonadota bacterium]